MIVDTAGLVWSLVVHPAGVQGNDRPAAGEAMWRLARRQWAPRLRLMWCDSAYRGMVNLWARVLGPWRVEMVRRTDGTAGFTVEPKRWVVERTFGWWNRYRRLSKDYERDPDSSRAMILIAMINLMARRLRPG